MADWSIYKSHGSGGKGDLTDPKDLPAAKEHKITLDIIPDANTSNNIVATVQGYMKEQFNYSVGAQYNKIIDIPASTGLLRYAKDVANADAAYHSGFFSKKMFEPGNAYSKLDLKFRIYDDPYVVQECDLLTVCCLPMVSGKIGGSRNAILNKNVIATGVSVGKNALNAAETVVEGAVDGGVAGATGAAIQAAMASTTRKPPHINVTIGSYFKKYDMVLTNLDFTFSKEFAYSETAKQSYPIFVDFNITLESLYSMLAIDNVDSVETNRTFGTGFGESMSGRRVRVVNAAVNENPVDAAIKSFVEGWNQ